METLDQALSRVWEHDWRHRRSGPTLRSQAETAIKALGSHHHPAIIESRAIRELTSMWYEDGIAPATIQKRLNCLSKLGVNVEGCKVAVPKQLKWHLPEDMKPHVTAWLHDGRLTVWDVVADFIEWTTLTGLRIEESLALDLGHFNMHFTEVSVPGTKTGSSQATLPLSSKAQRVAERCHNRQAPGDKGYVKYMFFNSDGHRLAYEELLEVWNEVRKAFGWQDDPTATLKALRRSAARYLHVDCGMPLDMVRQYLRHESINTTLEYLRLTGGYGTEEMRRYLK